MEGGSSIRHLIVGLLVVSHLATSALGGALLVRCQGADGHHAIEVTHPAACHDDTDALVDHASEHTQRFQNQEKHCTDEPATSPLLIRKLDSHHDTPVVASVVLYLTDVPQKLSPQRAAPTHIVPPDSANALTQSVILLI